MTWVGVGRSSFVPVYRLTFLNECCFTEVRVVSYETRVVCVLCIMFDVAVICSLKLMHIFDQQDSRVKLRLVII